MLKSGTGCTPASQYWEAETGLLQVRGQSGKKQNQSSNRLFLSSLPFSQNAMRKSTSPPHPGNEKLPATEDTPVPQKWGSLLVSPAVW